MASLIGIGLTPYFLVNICDDDSASLRKASLENLIFECLVYIFRLCKINHRVPFVNFTFDI